MKDKKPFDLLGAELLSLNEDFSNKIKELRKKYFINGKGLEVVLPINHNLEISFSISLDDLKIPSSL